MDTQHFKDHLNKLHSINNGKALITKQVVEFTQTHSEPIHSAQKALIEYTNSIHKENSYMITDVGQNQLFTLLLKVLNAKKVIDIGVYTGLSSLTFALAIPDDGVVIGLDCVNDYAETCHKFWKMSNVDHKVKLIVQDAKKSLNELLEKEGEAGTYDFIFIDADKDSYEAYYELSLKLIRKGGIIAFDNVLFFGATMVDQKSTNPEHQHYFGCPPFQKMVDALILFNEKISKDDRIIKTMLPLSDGITLVTKK